MFDAHAHLDFPEFDADRDAVLERAQARGVRGVVVPGVDEASWERARRLGFPYCVGVHPQWLQEDERDPAAIEAALRADPGAVGVGETGLDARVDVPAERQRAVFEAHLRAAAARSLPVVLHVVGRHGAALAILERHAPLRGMVHGFSGAPEVARRYLALGLHLSFGGLVTRPRALKARAAATAVPLERLLVETDSPSAPPDGAFAERNEPSLLPLVVEALAALRGETSELVGERTEANARALFGLVARARG